MKNILSTTPKIKFGIANFVAAFLLTVIEIKAQMPAVPVPTPGERGGDAAAAAVGGEDFTWWYISLFVLAVGLGAAIYWMSKNKKAVQATNVKTKKVEKENSDKWGVNSVDGDKEMEWLRKNQNIINKNGNKRATANRARKVAAEANEKNLQSSAAVEVEENLPIFSIERVEMARPFAQLPLSNDDALMSAVEQTHDEFEEDEVVRDIALRILQAFKTRNSVEALSQMALYDLSSSLRSKAVTALAEFNHESVFDIILLASADPTREVRAAAARALSKLTFDRADAWSRIFETEETGRMRQSARAAIESGFVEMSFDRLVHQDKKYAYEAFALMVLLIKAGETEMIFNALETNKNMNVRRALLHVVKVTKDARAVEEVSAMLERGNLPLGLREEADKMIEQIGFVMA